MHILPTPQSLNLESQEGLKQIQVYDNAVDRDLAVARISRRIETITKLG